MSTTPSPADRTGSADGDREIVPEIVEWLVAGLLALAGIATALAGSAVLWAADEALIAEAVAQAVADGSFDSDVLTPAQVTEIATSTAFWLGVGLVITGLVTLVVAVVYVVSRYRSRRSTGPPSERERLLSDAILGAVASALLSFVPGSPILGGGVAGYVHRRREGGATMAGALSGLLAAAPFVVVIVFLAVGLFAGFSNAGVGLGVVAALAMVVAIVGALIYSVGLGALGGYLAAVLATDDPHSGTGGDAPVDEESTSR